MTKTQSRALHGVLADLKRGLTYLDQPRVAIARKGQGDATTTLHFTRADGATLYEVAKDIGSELALLRTGIANLERFLAEQEGER